MKKLVLIGIIGSLMIMSFKPNKNGSIADVPALGDTILTTLNGYTKAQALDSIAYSDKTIDRRPRNTQIWFKKDIICKIDSLLNAEISGHGRKPDGIRIYFSRILASASVPINENNRIMIVSTYHRKDTIINGDTVKIHQDYFEHLKTPGLFEAKDIHGEPSHDNDTTKGALLLSRNPLGSLKACTLVSEHDIPRNMAEEMVWRFPKRSILRPGKMNARAEWFDMNMVDNLVKVLNREGDDGVRIYFSRGTTKYKLDSVKYKKDYAKNKVKFILVTTKAVPNTCTANCIHRDDLDCAKLLVAKLIDNAKDNGELCPTHCQGVVPSSN